MSAKLKAVAPKEAAVSELTKIRCAMENLKQDCHNHQWYIEGLAQLGRAGEDADEVRLDMTRDQIEALMLPALNQAENLTARLNTLIDRMMVEEKGGAQ